VRRLGRLAGVEPSAFSGGSLTMRAIPTLPTEDEGSHHGLRRRQWGRARAGDEEADTKNVDKVRGAIVVLIWLRFHSRQWWWRLLFLSDQEGEAEGQRDGVAVRVGRGCKVLTWVKGRGDQRGPFYRGLVRRKYEGAPAGSHCARNQWIQPFLVQNQNFRFPD
jgi:hypothetical protein